MAGKQEGQGGLEEQEEKEYTLINEKKADNF